MARRRAWLPTLIRGAFSRHALPPGPLVLLDQQEKSNRHFLLAHAARYGAIFKVIAGDEFGVCIVGLATCSRFLQEHAPRVRPVTLKLEHLFPKGFLRQMKGDDHAAYRKALIQAMRTENPECDLHDLEMIAAQGLRVLWRATKGGERHPAVALAEALTEMTTSMLLRIVYGVSPGTVVHENLFAGYRALGPHGLVWNPGPAQERAFQLLREVIRGDLVSSGATAPGLARRLDQAGQLDDTMLGNLIYMVEMGRYDLHGLFRWLTKYAGEHPVVVREIEAAGRAGPEQGFALARAFVLETLRLDQSERLLRRVEEDVVFDGYLIPRNTLVRLCLWESHKDKHSFPEPFRFHPHRFMTTPPRPDQFSPFGLDHHHCPFAAVAVRLGAAFMQALARDYEVTILGDGPPVRGAYHWETSTAFSVSLDRREAHESSP